MKTTLPGLLTFILLIWQQLPAQPVCFPAYRYAQTVTINNLVGVTLTDFQVRVNVNTQALVSANKMNPDGSDIRFAADDCCTPLPYWIQSGMNTGSTLIWVTVPTVLPAGQSTRITMYYGDTAATPVSHIDSVMASIGNDSTGTDTLVPGITVTTQKYAFPYDMRTVRWRIWSADSGRIKFKVANDTNMVTGSSPFFDISSVPGYYEFDVELRTVQGGYPGFYADTAMLLMSNCTPVTPCPGSCGDMTYEPLDLGTFGPLDRDTCGAVPNVKVWFRKEAFFDPVTSLGGEFDRQGTITAAANGPTTFCWGDSVSLTTDSLGGGVGFQWYRNGTMIPAATDTFYHVKESGTYTVAAIYGLCQFHWSNSIDATATLPNVDLGADRVVCTDTGTVLDAGPGFASYLWSDSSTGQTLTVTGSGTYIVTVWDTSGCTATDTVDITIQPLPDPVVTPMGPVLICPGETVVLDAFDPRWYAYTWNRAGETSANLIADTAASYYVVVYDSLNCSDTSNTVDVSFLSVPNVDLGPDTAFCTGGSLVLDAGPGWSAVMWPDSAGNQTYTVSTTGSYDVMVTDTNGCTDADTVDVGRWPLPVPNIGNDRVVCSGATTTLDGGAAYLAWDWSTGENTQAIDAGAGAYQVIVTDANGCQGSSNLVDVTEYPVQDAPAVSGDATGLTSTAAPNYQWLLDGSPLSGATGQTHVPTENGTYSVSVTDTNGCGTVTSNEVIILFGITAEDIPEGFSPNGDGINDNFVILNIGQFPENALSVMNRWGSAVYKAAPYDNGFNGISDQGSALPDGTYFYILDLGNDQEPFTGYLIINR